MLDCTLASLSAKNWLKTSMSIAELAGAQPVLTHANIVGGGMLASVNSVNTFNAASMIAV